ncbi:hypothetical protein HPB49_017915 [Dermacentor silvarum]|uniref:Uncharacterized protein n=1 Tax=Dermacentor silvarum TaxID=543639 RepID=A0ACB8E286_DERSI|nr:hypothetical protein HPB49_017915 [Dermacentor silvarum]
MLRHDLVHDGLMQCPKLSRPLVQRIVPGGTLSLAVQFENLIHLVDATLDHAAPKQSNNWNGIMRKCGMKQREKTGNKLFLLPDVRLSCFANDRHLLHQMFSEMNDEMSRISDPLSPIPEAPDNTEMIEQELRECTEIGLAKAKDCTLEKELGEAIRTSEIVRQ